jgi:hypothetical protein
MVIGVLAGTLGLVGCGDSETVGGGGSGGAGGSAGSGGQEPPLPTCGEGESIDETYETSEGLVECDGLGVITVPIGILLAAKPMGDIDGDVDFDVQVQFIIDEATSETLGALVQEAVIGEASADVDEVGGDSPVNVPATVPCAVQFSTDPDGPVLVTTPVTTATWTAIDGSIVLEVADMTFGISAPVPLPLSTKEPDPACIWLEMPTITFDAAPVP